MVSAIVTPSTDPITQLFLALALFGLYLCGSGVLIFLKK
jgi:Sec-independent protein secretion pathway component TatC